ncbi:MAG: bifunctional 5,10-methylenetetrahydrofolate dehydrogenase/5,10-methenyltetrahydrofolate cyclohydrolase [Chloroflexota bacterium]
MSAELLKGRPVAREIQGKTLGEIAGIRDRFGVLPKLAIVRIGENPSSAAYARSIIRAALKADVETELIDRQSTVSQKVAADLISQLSARNDIHGIILLQPLPPQLDAHQLAMLIPPAKDVDGANPWNVGRLAAGDRHAFAPSTPTGGMAILDHYGIEISARDAVVVGRSTVVGQPMAGLLLSRDATVTIAHSRTADLGSHTRRADILVTAAGQPNLVTADMVKAGAVVVDFGVTVVDEHLVGDVEASSVEYVASAITPVPGGTGSVTTAIVVRNTVTAARRQLAKRTNQPTEYF